ncbi:MAG TPA: SMI1/KNR4 family protein [Streptomyces sp.]|uniref:SMI1/KNR4 family protein n=1 Tax=Streptomyces sp. TaxID=1931 RepID=UPI002D2F65AD|nr:SMI1/KNR4 family protein [Streptomyces sp.]HZG06426.1 SMI1/KNR4 family protein [Streptomyces sp.]
MTSSITRSWRRIETWLSVHAPEAAAELTGPADPASIAAAERAIGLPFPEPLVECLLRHDGSGLCPVLPPYFHLLGADAVAAAWKVRTRIQDRSGDPHEDDDDLEPWWHRRWIPFAADGCGAYLVVDRRPGAGYGRIGEAHDEVGGEFERHAMWASLPAFFEHVATALETGDTLGHYRRTVTDDGRLAWEIL